MGHTTQGALLTCIDFRFQEAFPQYMKQKGIEGYDRISVAGATKAFMDPKPESETEFVLNQFDISVGLHKVQDIVLMNHEDCGAYGGRDAFDSANAEHDTHFDHMEKTASLLKERFPEVNVHTVWARIDDEGVITFEEIEPASQPEPVAIA